MAGRYFEFGRIVLEIGDFAGQVGEKTADPSGDAQNGQDKVQGFREGPVGHHEFNPEPIKKYFLDPATRIGHAFHIKPAGFAAIQIGIAPSQLIFLSRQLFLDLFECAGFFTQFLCKKGYIF